MLAQFRSSYDRGGRAQFRPRYLDETTAIALDTTTDACNIDSSLSSITDLMSSEPLVYMDTRSDAGLWRHFHVRLTNAAGKRPLFRTNTATRDDVGTPGVGYLPVYTQDFVTWTQAPSRTLVTGTPQYIEWQFTSAFPSGELFVSSHPIGRLTEADALATELLTTYSSVAAPAASADVNGVFATSPLETISTGAQVGGNEMYAIKLAFGGSTTDGGPKRKLVMAAQIHAGGEAQSWLCFDAFVHWLLDDASAEAVAMRANWDVWLYFALTPNGLKGGHRRWNFRSSTDPNRDFDDPTQLAEIAAFKTAAASDVVSCDVFLSWHGQPYRTEMWIPGKNVQNNTTPSSKVTQFIDLGTTVFGSSPYNYGSTTANTDAWWAQENLACDLCFHAELGTLGSTSDTAYRTAGENWAKTVQAADAAGMFASAALEGAATATASASGALTTGISLAGAATSVSNATGQTTTSINLAGSSAAVSTADGSLTTQITLSGAALAQAAAQAALTTGNQLEGDAQALATAIGSLTVQIRLAGEAVTQAVASADLTTQASGLSGSAQASATGSAMLTTSIPLVGEATATVTAQGGMTTAILLSGVSVGASSASGDLVALITLDGYSLAQALGSASLTTTIQLDGAAVSQAAGQGLLSGQATVYSQARTLSVNAEDRILVGA